MRKVFLLALAGLAALVAAMPGSVIPATTARQASSQYVVLYKIGASKAAAHAAIKAAGGTIVRENTRVGLATIRSSNPRFIAAATSKAAIKGAALSRRIGHVPRAFRKSGQVDKFAFEKGDLSGESSGGAAALSPAAALGAEPLAGLQWDMEMINATADTSHAVQPGEPGVTVGIIDTGIDGSHPDLAPNFNSALSRNFTTDLPFDELDNEIDGPCTDDPDGLCTDPGNVDENGHGTHVAGSVAAAANGLGIAGVAPKVTLVNLRAGQDSGFFFLQPSVDALTYAGDHGIDVVNMSYFVDPWLFNCKDHPDDSPAEQLQQRTIIEAMQRALRYAHRHGVTLVAAAGNGAQDYSKPAFDEFSPDFPLGKEKPRTVPTSCLDLPTEGKNVLSVTALGPSERKSFYSDYGAGHAFVAAPGGDSLDPALTNPENRILSTYPESVLLADGEIDEDGNVVGNRVVKDCRADGVCAFYRYLQGTSMASPHATGVAAVIASEFGKRDRKMGGLKLNPNRVERILKKSAREHACPEPRLVTYPEAIPIFETDFAAFCEGSRRYNGFYGHGIVDALAAANFHWDDDDDHDD